MIAPSLRRPAIIFLAAFVVLFAVCGQRFVLTNDEGIILHASQRMSEGARPYADFFGYMSPGSYWLQSAVFRLFGITYVAGRLPVIFGFALQCALLFWLTEHLSSRRAAYAALAVFAGFQIADPSFLTAQHRWDSATFALAGLCCAAGFAASPSPRARLLGLAASGVLMGAAAWCTPSIALTGVVVGVWLLASPARRNLAVPFVGGIAAVSLAAVARLSADGILWDFIRQMQWLQKNYSSVNVMAYGSVIGGYGKLLEGSAPAELPIRLLIIFGLALPAIAPPVAAIVWLACFARGKAPPQLTAPAILLLAAMAALIASAFPRADLMHLAFVAAVPYALAAAGLAHLLPAKPAAVLAFALMPLSLLFTTNNLTGLFASRAVPSPVGKLMVPADMADPISRLHTHVRPGHTLFVYPYLPVEYFLTQTKNPTRFSYLAPGMMTSEDERTVLGELQSNPPQWLLYLDLTDEEFLRVFPSAAGRDFRFHQLEKWLKQNYTADPNAPVDLRGYKLLKRV